MGVLHCFVIALFLHDDLLRHPYFADGNFHLLHLVPLSRVTIVVKMKFDLVNQVVSCGLRHRFLQGLLDLVGNNLHVDLERRPVDTREQALPLILYKRCP